MAFQFGTAERNASLDAVETSVGASPTLELTTGLPPANCAAADTGTDAATITLPADWMSAASAGSKALLGTWEVASAAGAASRVGHFRLKAGGTCRIQGLVSEPWTASRVYAVNDQVHNGGNVYRCTTGGTAASSGGPSGTGTGITDGGVTWNFVQAGTDLALDNTLIGAGQRVTVTSFNITAGGA
jgi:hypothetical protein